MRNNLNGHNYERITAGDVNPGDTICYANTEPAAITRIEQRDSNLGPFVILHWAYGGRPLPLRANQPVYRILDQQAQPEQEKEKDETRTGPGRPEVGPATNLRLGEERTARVDAIRGSGESRAAAIRNLLDYALDVLDVTTPPYSVAYGIGMTHGARAALRILDESTAEEIAAYVRGDKQWPDGDLTEGRPYTYVDLARDMGREITWDDVDFRRDDELNDWLGRVTDTYSQGHIHVLRGIVEAAHYAGRAELAHA